MTKKIVKLGIIGTNFAANVHLPAFRLNNNSVIYGITSKNKENAELIQKQYNIPKCYENWQEMILDPNIEAVSIAVPPIIQPQIILATLQQKKSYLC